MSANVIQLAQLEEFVREDLHQGNIVRVVVLDITESASSQIPGLRTAAVGVHVRVINDEGHILVCYLPVASVQLFNGRREGDPTWQAYDEAWEKAEALKERVIAYLQDIAADKEFTVSAAGVIDIGQVRPLRATWKSDPAPMRLNQSQGPKIIAQAIRRGSPALTGHIPQAARPSPFPTNHGARKGDYDAHPRLPQPRVPRLLPGARPAGRRSRAPLPAAIVASDDPETAYRLTQHVETWYENPGVTTVVRSRSTSVGDVLALPDGRLLVVASFGFEPLADAVLPAAGSALMQQLQTAISALTGGEN